MRSPTSATKALLVSLLCACRAHAPSPADLPQPDAQLRIGDRVFTKRALTGLTLVGGYDPHYGREKKFWAVPLDALLRDALPGDLANANIVVRGKAGEAVPFVGSRLLDGTAWLALADADHGSSWETFGPRHAGPAPFYLIWSGTDRVDLERFPRPWAIERIEQVRFEALYPHTAPSASASASAQHGYAMFSSVCTVCHAMNREGGHIGPDLNVPQSIVEYRPRNQIRAYIRNPLTFRYSTMPAHPELSEADLDALLAYFDDMRAHKVDPEHAP